MCPRGRSLDPLSSSPNRVQRRACCVVHSHAPKLVAARRSGRRTTVQHYQQIGAPRQQRCYHGCSYRGPRESLGLAGNSVGVHVKRGRIARSAAPGFFSPAYLAYVPLIFGPFLFPFPFLTTTLTSPSPRIRYRVSAAILNSPLPLCSLSRHPHDHLHFFTQVAISVIFPSFNEPRRVRSAAPIIFPSVNCRKQRWRLTVFIRAGDYARWTVVKVARFWSHDLGIASAFF